MALADWGWTDFFAGHFKSWKKSGYLPARVIRGEKNYFRVWSEAGELTVRFAGKMRHKADGRQDLPVVGDWVVVEPQPGERGFIHALLPRTSSFSRNLPGRRKGKGRERVEQQVIAANVDLVFIVSGLDRDYNLRRIERYLTLVGGSGAEAVILLNKADLCADPETCQQEVAEIAGNSPVHLCMARDRDTLAVLTPYLKKGKTIALLGSSGVGKSTILNGLLGEERQKIGSVSESDGKGRHTTTHRELFLLAGGAILMDNPGMRELHLWGEQEDLAESFAEIEELALTCKFSNCRHQTEPGCAVRTAVEQGEINQERLDNYLKLAEELKKTKR
ncbi:MAG: ribosome small subunit-dependent GTPase A [Desulfuromonas sp.]|nr:MAG: ribosome small subunit-dependent GTPase A [Desulfuromonas sp.]